MTALFHVQYASGQWSIPADKKRNHYRKVLGRKAHINGHSEAGSKEDQHLLSEACREFGYYLISPSNHHGGKTATPITVRKDLFIRSIGYIDVLDGQPGRPKDGGHAPAGLTEVTVEWGKNVINAQVTHMLTGWGGASPKRRLQILKQWETMGDEAESNAKGRELSITMADTNYDIDDNSPDTPSKILRRHGMWSVFDELDKSDLPTLVRRQIDMIYTMKRLDPRMSVVKIDVHRDSEGDGTAVDHSQVSAFLAIRSKA